MRFLISNWRIAASVSLLGMILLFGLGHPNHSSPDARFNELKRACATDRAGEFVQLSSSCMRLLRNVVEHWTTSHDSQ